MLVRIREYIINLNHQFDDLILRPNEKQKRKLDYRRSLEKQKRTLNDEIAAELKSKRRQENEILNQQQQAKRHKLYMQTTAACPACVSGRMRTKRIVQNHLLSYILFFSGIAVMLIFGCVLIGLIIGPIMCIAALCIGSSRKTVWKCDNCGIQADFTVNKN
jgi:hypothetical protein